MSRQTEKTSDVGVLERDKPKLKKPQKYKVVFLNDDYTPMQFVVDLLVKLFHHSPSAATQIMLHVHEKGRGIAGVYTRDIAETKVVQVAQSAHQSGHPLKAICEPE